MIIEASAAELVRAKDNRCLGKFHARVVTLPAGKS
jgi:hypothetical protein